MWAISIYHCFTEKVVYSMLCLAPFLLGPHAPTSALPLSRCGVLQRPGARSRAERSGWGCFQFRRTARRLENEFCPLRTVRAVSQTSAGSHAAGVVRKKVSPCSERRGETRGNRGSHKLSPPSAIRHPPPERQRAVPKNCTAGARYDLVSHERREFWRRA